MRGKTRERDGVYQRADRPGWWISFVDTEGQRRRRKVSGAHTLQQARAARPGRARPLPSARGALRAPGDLPAMAPPYRRVCSRNRDEAW
jgi:hypothetical protein